MSDQQIETLDDGDRVKLRGTHRDIDAAVEEIEMFIHSRPDGWRVRYATIQCNIERGNRIYTQAEVVSADWLLAKRARRDADANTAAPARDLTLPGS